MAWRAALLWGRPKPTAAKHRSRIDRLLRSIARVDDSDFAIPPESEPPVLEERWQTGAETKLRVSVLLMQSSLEGQRSEGEANTNVALGLLAVNAAGLAAVLAAGLSAATAWWCLSLVVFGLACWRLLYVLIRKDWDEGASIYDALAKDQGEAQFYAEVLCKQKLAHETNKLIVRNEQTMGLYPSIAFTVMAGVMAGLLLRA